MTINKTLIIFTKCLIAFESIGRRFIKTLEKVLQFAEMLCILCVKLPDQLIDIFGEEGLQLNAASVIVKHFWIQPNKSEEDARFVCTSCWEALYSFHKFYLQVEEAHITLVRTSTTGDDDLKQEDEQIVIQVEAQDVEKFDPCEDDEFLKTDVKQEVKEDADGHIPQYDPFPDNVSHTSKSNPRSSPDSSDSDDSESKVPLANLAKSRPRRRMRAKTESSDNDDMDTSPDWQDNHSDDDEYEDEDDEEDCHKEDIAIQMEIEKDLPKRKPIPSSKKPGRPCTKAPKTTTEDQIKKRELSQEYDEIIMKHMKLTCTICLIPIPNFFALKKHYRLKHNERGYASCCNKKLFKRGILVDHIHTHLNPEYFKCMKCNKVLADRRCLEVHMNVHVTGKQRIYQCHQCSKSFFKKPLLTRHLHIHIPEEERKFRCEDCNKFFPSNYTLRAHINNVHQNVYAKICDQCGKSIRGREAFQRHLLEHAGVPMPGVQCDKCGAKLRNKYGLKRHMNSMHAETNVPHVCNICGKVAPNSPALQRHYSYVHKCERKHKCPMCEKAFKKAGALKEHMSTHTGEVLYTCPHCPKTFNSNANMHSHRKKMHRKEWEENRRHPHMAAGSNAD